MKSENACRWIAVAFVVGLALRLLVVLLVPIQPSWDGVIYARAADDLAAGIGFTQRIYVPEWWASPTAFYPPGWPATLAVWRWLGFRGVSDLVLQAIFGSLIVPLAARAAWSLHGPRQATVVGWVLALWPGALIGVAGWMAEPLFGVLLLCALLPFLAPRWTALSTGAGALLWGVAGLVRPSVLPVLPWVVVAHAWGADRRGRCRRLLIAGVVSSAVCVPIAPWLARNHQRLGVEVPVTSAGYNLHVGAHTAYYAPLPPECELPRGLHERDRDARHRSQALAHVIDDPLGHAVRAVAKAGHTIGYEASPVLQMAAGLGRGSPRPRDWRGWIALCTVGWWLLVISAILARPSGRGRVLVAALFGALLVQMCFFGGDRYHLPWVPVLAVLGSRTWCRWADGARWCVETRRHSRGSPNPMGFGLESQRDI